MPISHLLPPILYSERQPAYQANVGRRGSGYNRVSTYGTAGAAGGYAAASSKRTGWQSFPRRRPFLCCFIVLVLLAIVGAGVGAGVSLATRDSKNLSSSKNGSSSNSDSTSSNNGSSKDDKNDSKPEEKIVPFERWDWTDNSKKVNGVSLGSWLLIERWQLEDWVIQQGGPEAYDEWRLMEALGDRKADVLKEHWETWVTEADMDKLKDAGINLIRIPIGYWAFIPTEGDEPYLTTGYVEQLDKMLKWCYDRGMYVMLDLHGMPGSQNGDQSSGHNTTNVLWFEQHQQDRSDAFLKATLDWYKASNYSSIINSIGVVNEPRVVNDHWNINQTKFEVTRDFYERSYATCRQYDIPMTFHHGFYPGTQKDKLDAWRDFASGKDPNYLLLEDHPYPGWFVQPRPGADAIRNAVCESGQLAVGYPVPIIVGEFSAVSDLNSTDFARQYMTNQLATYGWSAGSIFWNFKTLKSQAKVLADRDDIMELYSFFDLLDAGIMPTPQKGQDTKAWLQSLGNECGNFQNYGWNNPSRTGNGYSGRRRRDEESQQKRETFRFRRGT